MRKPKRTRALHLGDGAGNLFIADPGVFHAGPYGNGYGADRIRKVSPDGIITTIAGGGTLWGSNADGGPATSAQIYYPVGIAVDGAGNVFFSESLDADGGVSGRSKMRSASAINPALRLSR